MNMSYCRFENTYNDLVDCLEHINSVKSESELNYRNKLIEICSEILESYDSELKIEENENEH